MYIPFNLGVYGTGNLLPEYISASFSNFTTKSFTLTGIASNSSTFNLAITSMRPNNSGSNDPNIVNVVYGVNTYSITPTGPDNNWSFTYDYNNNGFSYAVGAFARPNSSKPDLPYLLTNELTRQYGSLSNFTGPNRLFSRPFLNPNPPGTGFQYLTSLMSSTGEYLKADNISIALPQSIFWTIVKGSVNNQNYGTYDAYYPATSPTGGWGDWSVDTSIPYGPFNQYENNGPNYYPLLPIDITGKMIFGPQSVYTGSGYAYIPVFNVLGVLTGPQSYNPSNPHAYNGVYIGSTLAYGPSALWSNQYYNKIAINLASNDQWYRILSVPVGSVQSSEGAPVMFCLISRLGQVAWGVASIYYNPNGGGTRGFSYLDISIFTTWSSCSGQNATAGKPLPDNPMLVFDSRQYGQYSGLYNITSSFIAAYSGVPTTALTGNPGYSNIYFSYNANTSGYLFFPSFAPLNTGDQYFKGTYLLPGLGPNSYNDDYRGTYFIYGINTNTQTYFVLSGKPYPIYNKTPPFSFSGRYTMQWNRQDLNVPSDWPAPRILTDTNGVTAVPTINIVSALDNLGIYPGIANPFNPQDNYTGYTLVAIPTTITTPLTVNAFYSSDGVNWVYRNKNDITVSNPCNFVNLVSKPATSNYSFGDWDLLGSNFAAWSNQGPPVYNSILQANYPF